MINTTSHKLILPALILSALMLGGCGAGVEGKIPVTPTVESTSTGTVTTTPAPTSTPTVIPTSTETPIPPTDAPEPRPTNMPPLSESGGGVIAFVSEASGSPGIYIMNADGSEQRMLSDEYDTHPDWSPDGKQIAFSTRRSDVVAIYSIDLQSMAVHPLTNTDRSPSAPDWSPDGEQLVIVYNPAHPGIDYELYLMSASGGRFEQLTDSAGYQSHASPDWSPDDTRIAFAADLEGNYDIYLMDPDGTNVQALTTDEANDNSPAWSPDGSKIAFESYRDGNWEIYVMNADGTGTQRLSDTPSKELWPSWSPDGARIAFQTDRDGNWEIYVMDADGSDQQRLTNNEVKDSEPAWRP